MKELSIMWFLIDDLFQVPLI